MTGLPPHYAPSSNTPARKGFADAGPGWLQALITTALLLPVVVVLYIQLRVVAPFDLWTKWALSVGVCAYFVVLVAVFGRVLWRRLTAAVLAVLVVILDRVLGSPAVLDALRDSSLSPTLLDWIYRVLFFVTAVAAVVTWGIARRRHLLWLVGMLAVPLLAIGMVAAYLAYNEHRRSKPVRSYDWLDVALNPTWLAGSWIVGIAIVALLGSLVCWAFDAIGGAQRSAPRR